MLHGACVLLLLKAAGVTHLGGSISPMEGAAAISGGKSLAKSNWSLVEVLLAAASIVSPSETTELVVLFMVSNDWEGRRADLRRRLYGLDLSFTVLLVIAEDEVVDEADEVEE